MTGVNQEWFEERAAIMEFEAGLSRDEAESKAKALLIKPPAPAEKPPTAKKLGKGYAKFRAYMENVKEKQ